MVKLISEVQGITVNVPTMISEFTPNALKTILGSVNLPEDYAVIALAQKIKLSQFAMIVDSPSKAENTLVYSIPFVAKLPEKTNYKGIINITDKVIVTRSALEMGTALSVSTKIRISSLTEFIKKDIALKKKCLEKTIEDSTGSKEVYIYVVDFKIIPMCDIKATIPVNALSIDPFSEHITLTPKTAN